MTPSIDSSALVDALADAVVACDAQGAIVLWNDAAERMFGFTRAEALGQSLDLIIPERLRKRHWEGYDKTMETGNTKYGHDVLRVPAVNKAGQAMSMAFTVAMLFDADKQGDIDRRRDARRDQPLQRRAGAEEAPDRARGPVGREGLGPHDEPGPARRSHPRLHACAVGSRPARSCWHGWAPT